MTDIWPRPAAAPEMVNMLEDAGPTSHPNLSLNLDVTSMQVSSN